MAALDDSSSGRARDRRSVYERYQEATGEQPVGAGDDHFPLETGSDGQPTEREDAEEGTDRISSPFDPERIDIETGSSTVDLLLSRLRNQMIDLAPDFQRRAGLWTDEKQSRLIESLLLRIPIPSFYIAEQKNGSWAVVDGIQRLTSIARFLDADIVDAALLWLRGLEYFNFAGSGFDDLSGKPQIRMRRQNSSFTSSVKAFPGL